MNNPQDLKSTHFPTLTWSHRESIAGLFGTSIHSLLGAFEARRLVVMPDGDTRDLGPDYSAGFAAVRALLNLLTQGRTPTKHVPRPTPVRERTFEELLTVVREYIHDEAPEICFCKEHFYVNYPGSAEGPYDEDEDARKNRTEQAAAKATKPEKPKPPRKARTKKPK